MTLLSSCPRQQLRPLTDAVVKALSPEASLADLAEDIAKIGYPQS